MSDTSQGPGWWQASDGKWYPPEQAPGAAPVTPPGGYGAPQPGYGAPMAGPAGGDLSAGAALSYGWKKFQEYVGPILIAALVYLVAVVVFSIVGNIFAYAIDDGVLGQLLLSFVQLLVSSAVAIVLIRAVLLIVDGQPLDTDKLFSTDNLGAYLIGSVIFSIVAVIGLALCVIPGLVFMFLAWFWGFFVVDKNMAPIDAMKASIDMVKAQAGAFLLWAVVATVVTIIGFLLCLVGTLVAAPVTYIGTAYMYRRANNEPVAA